MPQVSDEPYPFWWEMLPSGTFRKLVQGWRRRHPTPPVSEQDEEPCAKHSND